ncbi:MAG: HNH endonuclease [Ardenticatenia bacterium]|nr:HNH endonuclease [Ardenticatenia bacterium]
MGSVLVLNASYEPLNIVPVRRAVVLLLKEKAELVEAAGTLIRSEHLTIPTPLVIRLVVYVKIPHHLSLPLTRRNILLRDNYTCQYCGRRPGKEHLTIDHVVPRSRGGEHSWENLVAACAPCNRRKGNRLPHEAGVRLLRKPFKPRYLAVALLREQHVPEVWAKYLYF